jgi:hypothetical protein
MVYTSAAMRKIASQIKANKKIQYDMQKEVDTPYKPILFPNVTVVNIHVIVAKK